MTKQQTTLKENEYRCAHCGTVYQFTDFDAEAEFKENFPGCSIEFRVIICDDCFNNMPIKKYSEHWNSMTKEEQKKKAASFLRSIIHESNIRNR